MAGRGAHARSLPSWTLCPRAYKPYQHFSECRQPCSGLTIHTSGGGHPLGWRYLLSEAVVQSSGLAQAGPELARSRRCGPSEEARARSLGPSRHLLSGVQLLHMHRSKRSPGCAGQRGWATSGGAHGGGQSRRASAGCGAVASERVPTRPQHLGRKRSRTWAAFSLRVCVFYLSRHHFQPFLPTT